jgi:hypothetical protein
MKGDSRKSPQASDDIRDTALMLDEAKPENLKAMIVFTKEYSVYS